MLRQTALTARISKWDVVPSNSWLAAHNDTINALQLACKPKQREEAYTNVNSWKAEVKQNFPPATRLTCKPASAMNPSITAVTTSNAPHLSNGLNAHREPVRNKRQIIL